MQTNVAGKYGVVLNLVYGNKPWSLYYNFHIAFEASLVQSNGFKKTFMSII